MAASRGIGYRLNVPITVDQLADVFRESGIRRPVDDHATLAKMIEHGNLTVTAWDGEALVGIGRSLTDFSYCCYLSDLAVRRSYQNRGIGRELVERTRREIGPDVMLILLSSPTAMAFYPRVGFLPMKRAWAIARRGDEAYFAAGDTGAA